MSSTVFLTRAVEYNSTSLTRPIHEFWSSGIHLEYEQIARISGLSTAQCGMSSYRPGPSGRSVL